MTGRPRSLGVWGRKMIQESAGLFDGFYRKSNAVGPEIL